MGDNAENEEKASGDTSLKAEQTTESIKTVEAPIIPNVELIVDGFGFMPNRKRKGSSSESVIEEHAEDAKNICASSSNIDIVRRYTWKTKNRMTVQVITYGATITSIHVPDRNGVPDDVIAGFGTLEEYFKNDNPYFGATIGRYANVIRDGTITMPSGKVHMLTTNYKKHHHYNGGYVGFDKVNWRSYVKGKKVIMTHVSERFNEGYPGTVMAQVTFEVTCDNIIKIEMKCHSSEPTVINMSNVQYFNLGGHHAGSEIMYDHIITINADKYTSTEDNDIITGEKKVVGGTAFDFRVPRVLRTMISNMPMGGYNVNYCITQGTEQDLTFQGRALHPFTGRVLEVYSNQPGMQFYTGNLLPDPEKMIKKSEEYGEEGESEEEGEEGEEGEEHEEGNEEEEGERGYGYVPLMGKNGTYYKKHGFFCMMPQNYPDSVNHKNFPTSVLNPGEVYIHRIQYKFGILLGRYI